MSRACGLPDRVTTSHDVADIHRPGLEVIKQGKSLENEIKENTNKKKNTIMATRRPARIPEDLARDMILNGWDEEPIGGIDSGSDISDVEDPEYCPSGVL
ncbi:hypothetical protein MHYP_G00162260 [Metynnis hypsauchen]